MPRPRVTVLSPDASSNCLGRALLLADILQGVASTQVAALQLGPAVWAPASAWDVSLQVYPLRDARRLGEARTWLRGLVRASDALVVSKPKPTSAGLALLSAPLSRPVVLDIDDWEPGLLAEDEAGGRRLATKLYQLAHPRLLNSELGVRLLDLALPLFRHRTVSNRWLQARYGGALLPHVRDAARLDPARVDARPLRRSLDLEQRTWVGFVGTARPHKGLEVLVEALSRLPGGPGLLLLGLDPTDPYAAGLLQRARAALGEARLRTAPPFPFDRLAEHVALADVVAIPSLDVAASRGQLPAKVFDAMAMARAIVASAVNDLPEVLADAGLLVAPGDPAALASALARLAEDPAERAALGARARARLVARYDYAAGRSALWGALREAGCA